MGMRNGRETEEERERQDVRRTADLDVFLAQLGHGERRDGPARVAYEDDRAQAANQLEVELPPILSPSALHLNSRSKRDATCP